MITQAHRRKGQQCGATPVFNEFNYDQIRDISSILPQETTGCLPHIKCRICLCVSIPDLPDAINYTLFKVELQYTNIRYYRGYTIIR